jgi:hypothetical protein
VASKHYVRLPSDLITRVWKWACVEIDAGRFQNQYTTHDAQKKPELQALSKLSEYAFAQWCGLDQTAVTLGSVADDGGDVDVEQYRIDVKSCEMGKSLLLWPASKASKFDEKNFTHFVLVKYEFPPSQFQIVGWVTKQRFRRERLVATADSKPRLDIGTRYMHENSLDDMNEFIPDTRAKLHKPFEHYCRCGKWGAFGFGVNVRAGIDGQWFCFEHRPTPLENRK